MPLPTFSVVIETENLALGGVADLERCLDSLALQTIDITTAKNVWILVGGHLDPADAATIGRKYPWVQLHQSNDELHYLAAKRQGARMSDGQYVFFADSDVAYDPDWIEMLLTNLEGKPPGTVMSSDTRVPLDSSYGFAMQVAWMLPVFAQGGPVEETRAFRLNNFAIDRETMATSEFDEGLPLYRGTFGYWRKRLLKAGSRFYRFPRAMAYHLAPQGFKEWWYRMLVFGADYVATANYKLQPDGTLVMKSAPLRRAWYAIKWIAYRWVMSVVQTVMLLGQQPAMWRYVLLGVPIALASNIVVTLGCIVTVFNSRLVFDSLAAYEDGE